MNIGVCGCFDLCVEVGLFFNNDYVGFVDYCYFMGNQFILIIVMFVGSYCCLFYYEFSIMDWFVGVLVYYQFRKLLVIQFLEVCLMGIKENLFVNVLIILVFGIYYEFGYFLDNILWFFWVEVVVGFDNGGYCDWGIFVGIVFGISGGIFSIGD